MRKPSSGDNSKRLKLPKRAQGQSPHDVSTLIEEAVVYLHALTHYCEDELTPEELSFLKVAKKNLAKMHRRVRRGND